MADASSTLERFYELSIDLLATASLRDGTWHSANPAFERILGWSSEELVGQPFFDIVHPDDLAVSEAAAAGLGRGEALVDFEHRVRCKDGRYRWIAWHTAALADEGLMYCIGRDVTARREIGERQAFLLKLHDGLRDVGDPVSVQEAAQRILGEQLGADRVAYAEDVGDGEHVELTRDWTNGVPSIVGRYRYDDYGAELVEALQTGRPSVRPDIQSDPLMTPGEKAAHVALGLGATLNLPLSRKGRPVAILAVHYARPHDFTPFEIELAQETAQRTWAAVEQARAERALSGEQRFRAFVTASSDIVFRMSPDWLTMRQLDGRGLLTDTREPSGTWMESYIVPEDRPKMTAAIEQAIRHQTMFELTHRMRRLDGSIGWTLSRASPILDDKGKIVEWLGAASDVTECKRAEQALGESEERFRSFAETSTDTLWIVDAETGQLEYLSPAFERMWGERREAVMTDIGRWAEKVHPDDREEASRALPRAFAGESYTAEYRILRAANDDVRWIRDTGFPIRDASGRVIRVGGIAQDVTDEQEAARRSATLLAELQHRVRNVLAVTRSIVRRTADDQRSTEDYVQHLDGRLAALARTQVLLTRKADAGVALEDILRDELRSQAAHDAQVQLGGPEIELAPKAAEVLTLAIHELATNAMKYGALYRPEGRLRIDWQIEERSGGRSLVLRWVESGVPVVEPAPRREGFGLELITQRVPYELRGSGTFELRPGGLHSRIEFPLVPGQSILQTGGVPA